MTPPTSRPRRLASLALALGAAAALAGPAAAGNGPFLQLEEPPAVHDLLFDADSQVDGAARDDKLGWGVATGDVNGDGAEDTVVGKSGGAAVLFGALPPLLDLALFPAEGFQIVGPSAGNVQVVGDVNGDGKDDIAIDNGNLDEWSIVLGKADASTVDPRALGGGGFVVEVSDTTSRDTEIAGAGDVNDDGIGDLLVFDGQAGRNGKVFVVFGAARTERVRTPRLGTRGYEIRLPRGASDAAISDAGDVNGDGKGDVLIGIPGYTYGGTESAGGVWVVFGKANTTPIELAELGTGGYLMVTGGSFDRLGQSVRNAGDVSGDGTPDHALTLDADVLVVFGRPNKTSTLVIDDVDDFRGYRIDSPGTSYYAEIAAGEDVSGDGVPDIVVADSASDLGRTDAGSVWLVHGTSEKRTIDLESFTGGFRIDGPARDAELGWRGVALHRTGNSVGVIAASVSNDANGRRDSGSLFEVDGAFQFDPPPLDSALLELAAGQRELAGAGGSPVLKLTVTAPVRIEAVLTRVTKGRPTRSGRCVPLTPKEGQRGCPIVRRVRSVSVAVRQPREVSIPIRASFAPGQYVLRVRVTDQDGRTWGPWRARFQVDA